VDAAYAGLLAGLAVGTKVSMAPAAVILALWFLFPRQGSNLRLPGRAALVVVFTIGAALTGLFWYARNVVWTGNPLSPGARGSPGSATAITTLSSAVSSSSHLSVSPPRNRAYYERPRGHGARGMDAMRRGFRGDPWRPARPT